MSGRGVCIYGIMKNIVDENGVCHYTLGTKVKAANRILTATTALLKQ